MKTTATVYLAGPMSGKPLWNFPAFDEARDKLIEGGWQVISPADLDREVGFDPASPFIPDKKFLDEAMERDLEAIRKVDAMAMLPGWENSTGAKAEYWLARWRHIPIYSWPSMTHIPKPGAVDPKAAVGSTKCPMHLLPPVALEHTAWAHKLGADRYGPYNWRVTPIQIPTYVGAIMRHLMAIAKGEWLDPESGKPHAAHIAASCNILMDADAHGKIIPTETTP